MKLRRFSQSSASEELAGLIYGENINSSLLRLFAPGHRVLDIGCGAGAWGAALKARGAQELVGIEISDTAAALAEQRYDDVHRDSVEELTLGALGARRFDTIVAADVIEHLVDPWKELSRWREWVAPSANLVLSVPNLRYFRILVRLAVEGRFDYDDAGGLMDRTHLRWFTKKSLTDELLKAGWRPEKWGRPSGQRSLRISQLFQGRLDELLAPQLQAVCVPLD
jgi:2-polyprenyl-3-methyl-5-hydroxy-6-metoxy-1,4-benzoquinol methylase